MKGEHDFSKSPGAVCGMFTDSSVKTLRNGGSRKRVKYGL